MQKWALLVQAHADRTHEWSCIFPTGSRRDSLTVQVKDLSCLSRWLDNFLCVDHRTYWIWGLGIHRLKQAGVSLKIYKYQLFTSKVKYLGPIVRQGTIEFEEASKSLEVSRSLQNSYPISDIPRLNQRELALHQSVQEKCATTLRYSEI